MKNSKRILAMVLVLVFMFTLTMSSAVFAGTEKDKGNEKSTTTDTEKVKGNEKNELKGAEAEDTTVETEEEKTEEEKAVEGKDALLAEKKGYKKQIIEFRKAGTEASAEAAEALAKYLECKEQLKLMVRDQYTEEELTQLEQTAAEIEAADPTLEVLPVEKVIAKGRSMKLDLPPIFKEGRVLVPIRAFSKAYGADVQWNDEENQITIISAEGVKIVIDMDTNEVTVDGEAVTLEMPVKSINGRTVMPVGFLAEQLGLKVEVDEEDGTIEIEEDEEEDDDTIED